ncbi:hypothetical protein B9G55_04425 [Saccharibacillus sp. O16]|nr:hypothetical protein B9G55_04425 [Saccharibacillus sp. O16]
MQTLELNIPPFPQIAAIGHGIWKRGMIHAQRVFGAHDLIICGSGALFIEEGDQRYEIRPGCMLVLEAGKRHGGFRATEEDTEVYWIHYQHDGAAAEALNQDQAPGKPLLPRSSQEIQPSPGKVVIPKFAEVDLNELRPLLDRMLALYETLTLARSYELHIEFGRLLLRLQQSLYSSASRSRGDRLGELAAAYIADRLESPFDSAAMERDLHYHFDYLSRCLKQYTGLSPLAYRHRLQIERAKRLLAHSDEPLARIGERCGFPDPSYFARLFKRETSLTPGEYRRRHNVIQSE